MVVGETKVVRIAQRSGVNEDGSRDHADASWRVVQSVGVVLGRTHQRNATHFCVAMNVRSKSPESTSL